MHDEQVTFDRAAALFGRYGLALSEAQYRQLARYAEMLVDEAGRQNVSAVRTVPEIWVRHFLDAAYLLRAVPEGARVLDLGTGGGVPGIPLAILGRPGVVMLDSELKKIEFCQRVVDELRLDAHPIAARAEELGRDAVYRGQFDVVVSRAMAAGSMLSELALPFLRVGGQLLAMKGRSYDPAVERFAEAAEKLGGTLLPPEKYVLEGEQKFLISVEKTAETPELYPRRFAKIKRSPL